MIPDLVRKPASDILRKHSKERSYFAWILTDRVNLRTVSKLCDTTSGRSANTRSKLYHCPLKSGIRVSKVVPGLSRRMAFIVSAQMIEPPSLSSSRSTEVMTQCFTPISFTERATLLGSSSSTGRGRPVATAQKEQERVHMLPNIIKVAVPAPQHSPILGQFPLSQIVWRRCSSTKSLTCLYSFPTGSFTRSQSGFFFIESAGITGNFIIIHKCT